MKAMVMDDDARICRALSRAIIKSGFDAITLSDPTQFLDAIERERPELLFLDLNMPKVDGVQLLKSMPEDLPMQVYLMSGVDPSVIASTFKMAKGRGGAVKGTITKPLDWTKIVETLVAAKIELEGRALQELKEQATLDSSSPSRQEIPLSTIDIDQGIQKLQIRMHYQPKVELDSGNIVGVEALARWVHPTLGNIPPIVFIPFAEKSGQIKELTLHLFSYALADFKLLPSRFGEIKLSFNISACMLGDNALPDLLAGQLKNVGLAPEDVILEITETATSEDRYMAMEILSRFRLKGFGLSLDDYGTGYSSLVQLLDFPFSELKIDRSFISGLGTESDKESRIILESTLEMANKFGLTTVGEGIEDSETMKWLTMHGCQEGQGYYISKPQSIISLMSWYEEYKKSNQGGMEEKASTSEDAVTT